MLTWSWLQTNALVDATSTRTTADHLVVVALDGYWMISNFRAPIARASLGGVIRGDGL